MSKTPLFPRIVPRLHIVLIAVVLLCASGGADETALVLAGSKPNVVLPDEAAFDFETAMTVETWVWFDGGVTPPKWEAIVAKGDTAWGLMRYNDTNQVCFRTHNGLQIHDLVSPVELTTDTWYHVAATYDGSAKALYLNGEEVANVPWTGPIALNEFNVVFGANEEKSGRSLAGRLDTVRIWSIGCTQVQIGAGMLRRLYGNETGLVGCWRFDEAADSAEAVDSSLQARAAAVTTDAVPMRIAGVAMGAPWPGNRVLTFDGTDERVQIPVSVESRFDATDTMTVEMWLQVESVTDSFGIRTPLVSKGSGGWEFGIKPSRKLEFSAGGGMLLGATALDLATWYHVAAVFDNGTKRIYINGALDSEEAGIGVMEENDLPVRIGHSGWMASPYFHGRADNVRIWRSARTTKQIADNTMRLINGNEPDLVAAWEFDTYNGNCAADSRTVTRDPADNTLEFNSFGHADASIQLHDSPLTAGTGVGMSRITDIGGEEKLGVLGELHPSYSGSAAFYNPSSLATTSLELTNGQPFQLRTLTIANAPTTTTTLNAETAGANVAVEVASAAVFAVGDTVSVRDGTNDEASVTIEAITGNTLTLDLASAKAAGAVVSVVQPTADVTFTATKDDTAGTLIEQTVTVDGGTANPRTVTFAGFDNIVDVTWRRTSLPNNSRIFHQIDNIALRIAAASPTNSPADGEMTNMTNLNRVGADSEYDAPFRPQYAVALNGSTDYLIAPHHDVLSLTDLTIEAWIKPASTGARQTILRKGESGYALTIGDDGKLEFWVDDQAGNVLKSSTPVTPDVWQQVAVRVDKFTDKTVFFINGIPAGTHAFSIVANNAEETVFGRKGPNTDAEYFQGGLDEVR
ncbi:MAG: LamG domain-containing protein, partial [Lentisphaerae bacterium]|nr:LamG domain-containing protein [Lentisphaerota bacterium]